MPSKNDLSGLKTPERQPILPKAGQANDGAPVVTKGKKPLTEKPGRAGRKPKTKAEKRSHKIMLSLTPDEGATVKAKAGLASEATLVYDHLKKTGFFD
jgi:hypothetical protein